jgi:hypothetical protein
MKYNTNLKLSNYKDYPLKEEREEKSVPFTQHNYVLYPAKIQKIAHKSNGKRTSKLVWMAAEVLLPYGFIKPSMRTGKVDFETFDLCKAACDVHNKVCGYTPEQAEEIVSLSMENSKIHANIFA